MKTHTTLSSLTGLALLPLLAASSMAQTPQPFGPTAVPCNSPGWKNCRVSFDGATVIRTFIHPRGGPSTQTNAGCSAQGRKITCPAGSYVTDSGFRGAAEPISINLDGRGRPTSTGH